jgi:anti-sigma factor RsiW
MMKITENWALHAYADGELEYAERAEIERLLAVSPEMRAELSAVKAQAEAVRASFADAVNEPVPRSLLAAARRRPARAWPAFASIAAGLAMLIVGGAGGWVASRTVADLQTASLPERAFSAYEVYAVDARHAVEVGASEQDHLQSWLSKRVGAPIVAPDLSPEGYNLLGGRLLADGAKPAGMLVYEDANKKRVVAFLVANGRKNSSAFEIEQKGKLVICYWRDADLVYAFVGEKTPEDMKQLAEAAHRQFEG